MRISALLLPLLIIGCATGFQPADKRGFGYRIKKLNESNLYTHTASFIGNTSTRKKNADAYARMAAVKHCEKENKLAIMSEKSHDFSKNYLSTNLGSTTNGGLYTYTSHETMPAFILAFTCVDRFMVLPNVEQLQLVSKELMKNFVDDFGGAVQVSKIAKSGVLKADDVITKVDGKRVKNPGKLAEALQATQTGSVNLTFIRAKKKMTKSVLLVNNINAIKYLVSLAKQKYCEAEHPPVRGTDRSKRNIESCLEEL